MSKYCYYFSPYSYFDHRPGLSYLNMQSLKRKPYSKYLRALIEVSFIMFLFYANLLMGEFVRSGKAQGKGLLWAMHDVLTPGNFLIGITAAMIGYLVFEFLRRKI
jgi:hypothetical protein